MTGSLNLLVMLKTSFINVTIFKVKVDVIPGGKISKDYQTKAFTICRQRIAEGGYRLASLIEDVYKAYQKKKETLKGTKKEKEVLKFLN